MPRYLFDIETNGFLDELTTIHCLVIKDIDTQQLHSYGPSEIPEGLSLLSGADLIAGHNILKFDLPAIRKVYPQWTTQAVIRDTLVLTRLIWTNIKESDFDRWHKDKEAFPGNLIGLHSLKAWGYRLGEFKGDFKGPWETWTEEMQRYCEQDVEVTYQLWKRIEAKKYSEEAIQLEHDFAELIWRQEQHGFVFDKSKAVALYATLCQKRTELEEQLQDAFPPWEVSSVFIPKANNKTRGYVKGEPFRKVSVVSFNPNSRDHIADRLKAKYHWTPTVFTDGGKPQVDESVLSKLPYPEAQLLCEYLLIEKRIGQLAEGKEAWLKVERKGRIHGSVNTNGAVTGRCTHSKPNIAQVPGVKAPYGKECRELFAVDPGYKLVGADASGLELRCLAHYMAKWDKGAYAKELLEGDIHTANQIAAGLVTREQAKTFIYGFLKF